MVTGEISTTNVNLGKTVTQDWESIHLLRQMFLTTRTDMYPATTRQETEESASNSHVTDSHVTSSHVTDSHVT